MQFVPFVPPFTEAAENIAAFIAHWRPLVSELPNTESFDSDNWDLREAGMIRVHSRGNGRLGLPFTKYNPGDQQNEELPLDQPLRDLAKAWTLKRIAEDSLKSNSALKQLLQVWRHLDAGLLARGLKSSPEFLTPDLLDEVNLAIRKCEWNDQYKYSLCLLLNRLVEELQKDGMLRTHFDWAGVVVHPIYNFTRVGEEHDRVRKEKLPTEQEMQAVGHVFHHAVHPRHRFPIAVATLLSGQPGRIGEVLTLSVNCAFDDERGGKPVFRIRWLPEKGGMPMTKDFSYATCPWIPHFKTALAWLLEIGEPARKIAKWYEENPGKIHLPEHLEHLRSKEWLSVEEVATILQSPTSGYASRFEWNVLRHREIPLHGKSGGERKVLFTDVERSVLAELPKGFPFRDRASGLKYSETLLLARRQEFVGCRRADDSPSQTMFYVPCVTWLHKILDKAFDDFGLTNDIGSPIRLRSHEFRHRWCTRAEEAGVWRSFNNAMSGRLKISQANAYDHVPADFLLQVRAENLKDDGRLFGEIVAFIPKEPMYLYEVERQIDELAQLKAIVVTPYGICINDFVQSPCEYHLDCLNCRNHACIKGLPIRTENIRKRLALQEKALAMARIALENGDYGVEDHIKNTLEPNVQRLRAIVSILDDPRFKVGTEIILSEGPQNHPITKALQVRIATLKEQGLDTSAEEAMLLPPGKSLDLGLDADI